MYIVICICVYASEALNGCINCIAKNRDAVDALDAPMKYLICTVVLLGEPTCTCTVCVLNQFVAEMIERYISRSKFSVIDD